MLFIYVNTNVITNIITNVKALSRVTFTYVNTNVITYAIANIITNVIAEEQQTYKRTQDSHNSSTNASSLRTYKNQ